MNCRDTLSSTGKFELGMENTVDKTTYCTEWDKGGGGGGGVVLASWSMQTLGIYPGIYKVAFLLFFKLLTVTNQ